MSKIVKELEIPIFVLKMIEYLGIPMSSLPLQPKKCLIFWDFPMKNVVEICGIPMSSLGGVHLISGIAHLAPNREEDSFQAHCPGFQSFHFSSPGYYFHIFNLVSTKLNIVSVQIWPLHLRSLVPKNKQAIVPFLWLGLIFGNGLPSSVRTVDHMDRFKKQT